MEAGDDGHIRTGTLWTGVSHAFTAIVGSGILALPWSVAQLGWILGPIILVLFAILTYYTAILLCDCYRTTDPITGRRNHTYIHAVKSFLGPRNVLFCAIVQYAILWGTMIGYTVTTSISIAAVKRLNCHHEKGKDARCDVSGNLYMVIYGALEIFLSQCPNLEKVTILSVIAAITSFAYALIALCLSTAKLFTNGHVKGSYMVAMTDNPVHLSIKIWHVFQALGNIAFAYTYAMLLLEIQDTLKSPPAENKVMKKVTKFAIGGTALFYISLGCIGFAAFGNNVAGNVLTGFDKPFWLVDVGNIAVIIHLIGAYQVFAQPIFAIHEKVFASRWPTSFLNTTQSIRLPCIKESVGKFTMSRPLLRTVFVIFTTMVAMMLPFFNAILGLLGSISFWPLTIYFPLSMYTVQAKIKRGSSTWIFYQVLSLACLMVTLVAAIGSVADISESLKHAKLFHSEL